MRYKTLLPLTLFVSACAPLLCHEAEVLKRSHSEAGVPASYEASLSLRHGLLRLPLQVQKREGKFIIRGEGRTAELDLNRLCLGGVCLDMPINPDGLLFGKVLRGDERVECSSSGVSFEREEGLFRWKYVFKEGRLSLVEFYDRRRDSILKLSYLEWSGEGYARAIRLERENFNLLLTVDSLKF
ncbi:MAG: hypothetical protein NZL86_07310 [Aquificaceae bacterium]|nr:hypothetical protein [Aquificaceae bacterium]